jgi:hypothetical protein
VDPARVPGLEAPFNELVAMAVAPKGKKRVPLAVVCSLLAELDVAAFERALDAWKSAPADAPGAHVLRAMARQRETLEDPELALRMAVLLASRPGRAGTESKTGVQKRFTRHVKPHIESYLVSKGARLRAHLDAIETKGDATLASVVKALEKA